MRSYADHTRIAALAAAAALLACSSRSTTTQVKEALAALAPVELPQDDVRVALQRVAFTDVAVSPEGDRALIVAMVDAGGRVRIPGGDPMFAYVGRESFAMERCAERRWCLAPDALAGMRGVAAALAHAPREKGSRPLAWQVRVERDAGQAGEDYEGLRGSGPTRMRDNYALKRDASGWHVLPPQ